VVNGDDESTREFMSVHIYILRYINIWRLQWLNSRRHAIFLLIKKGIYNVFI